MTHALDNAEVDRHYMRRALTFAVKGAELDEVPVGALVVRDGIVLGEGFNQPIGKHDPTGHAEIMALRAAAVTAQNYRLPGATLYVTLEPCVMCAGAIMHSRIERVVFGASDPKTGACGSAVDLFSEAKLKHHARVIGGVLADESVALLRGFFASRRGSVSAE